MNANMSEESIQKKMEKKNNPELKLLFEFLKVWKNDVPVGPALYKKMEEYIHVI